MRHMAISYIFVYIGMSILTYMSKIIPRTRTQYHVLQTTFAVDSPFTT